MAQRMPESYRIDLTDPRAPSEEQWARMSPEDRARVVAMLPGEVSMDLQPPPEGDPHRIAKNRATDTLDAYFRRIHRKIYVSSELAVFYPDEPRFSPDVLAVLDVEPRERDKWVVAAEGRGLDLVIEVHYGGDADKDFKKNVERYARLGIKEYFIFDRARLSLRGYQLPEEEPGRSGRARAYRPIVPQQGRYSSEVLTLDLTVEGARLRFLTGMATVPEAEELISKLGTMVDELLGHKQEAEERAQAEAERAQAEAERAQAQTERAAAAEARIKELEQQLAEIRAQMERLRRGE